MARINEQAKSLLARLLAMENLSVVHNADAPTASFNIKDRTLTLPILKDMQGFHYDGYIAHEISHALYTPYEEEKLKKLYDEVPKDFVNITEDARIERLCQNKYPGTRKDFYQMYEDFAKPERDMFGLKEMEIKETTTIDRINLFFKIGRFENVPFNKEEEKFVKMVDNAITFDDAIEAARQIHKYMKETNQPCPPLGDKDGQGEGGEGDQKGNGKSGGFTQREFDKNRDAQLVDGDAKNSGIVCGEALTSADIQRDTIVNNKVFEKLKKTPIKSPQYQAFMTLVKPTVNMMVNQFNVRKSASDYKKTKISKSGKLDMKEISKFMTSPDIFKRNEIVFEEKNHGFVFFIDWSGSMGSTILETYKQLLVLMYFCRKVSIPFEVYGFTSGSSGIKASTLPKNKIVAPSISSNNIFLLIESCMSKKAFEEIAETIFSGIGGVHQMGDTPLYNTALLSDIILENFKKKYGREKNVVVLLSDGGAGDRMQNQTIISNQAMSKNYTINTYHDVFKYMKDRQKITKMIGLYITNRIDTGVVDVIYPDRDTKGNDYVKHFENKKWVAFDKGVAFDKYFAIDISHFQLTDRDSRHFTQIDKYATNKKIMAGYEAKMKSLSKNMMFMNIFINEIS